MLSSQVTAGDQQQTVLAELHESASPSDVDSLHQLHRHQCWLHKVGHPWWTVWEFLPFRSWLSSLTPSTPTLNAQGSHPWWTAWECPPFSPWLSPLTPSTPMPTAQGRSSMVNCVRVPSLQTLTLFTNSHQHQCWLHQVGNPWWTVWRCWCFTSADCTR